MIGKVAAFSVSTRKMGSKSPVQTRIECVMYYVLFIMVEISWLRDTRYIKAYILSLTLLLLTINNSDPIIDYSTSSDSNCHAVVSCNSCNGALDINTHEVLWGHGGSPPDPQPLSWYKRLLRETEREQEHS